MKPISIPRATAWILVTLFANAILWAAIPRLSQDALREKAERVVAGEVIEVIKKDGPVVIHLKVSSVSKGAPIGKDTVIEIQSWSASLSKRMRPPGPQGLSPIPEVGDQVIAYLTNELKPLLPNGFVIKPKGL